MKPRVVLFTRSSRPSGAQMAWRLVQSGFVPSAVVVEERGRMVGRQAGSRLVLLRKVGLGFVWKRVLEAIRIRLQFFCRRLLRKRFQSPAYLSIEEWALDHPSIPILHVADHNSGETQDLLRRLNPDVGVLTNTRRIKKDVLEIPRHGFFNLHLSALPKYAGLDSIFWALYHGEKEIGVTIHLASEEIDRGDILLQEKIPVNCLDDEESIYNKALWLGTSLMVQSLRHLEQGTLQRRPQEREESSYFSWPGVRERAALKERRRQERITGDAGSERIRVLHLITRMTRGGAQENTLATVRGLARKGYQVTLGTGPSWGEEGEILSEALQEGLEVVILPELVREIHPWKDLKAVVRLTSWLARNRYDIIHTHTSKAGFLGRVAGRLGRVPVVIHTPHGHVFHSYFSPWKEQLFLRMERSAAGWSDRLVALTHRCCQEHLALKVGRAGQWLTIPSGVDETKYQVGPSARAAARAKFGIPAGRKVIGFVGRLAPVKGPRYLIEALPEILKEIPDVHCLILGDGEEKESLEGRVEELGLASRAALVGHQEAVAEGMACFDILVVPSLNEGMGRVIVEAGFLKKPVVGTRVGGIPDLIEDGETGLLIESRNSHELAQAAVRLLKDPELCEHLGRQLQAKVLNGFTETQMIDRIDRLYQEVLREKGISRDACLEGVPR